MLNQVSKPLSSYKMFPNQDSQGTASFVFAPIYQFICVAEFAFEKLHIHILPAFPCTLRIKMAVIEFENALDFGKLVYIHFTLMRICLQ